MRGGSSTEERVRNRDEVTGYNGESMKIIDRYRHSPEAATVISSHIINKKDTYVQRSLSNINDA